MKETITIYGTEVDRAELAAALIEAELNSYRNKNLDYCVILDTETGKPEVDQYTPGSSSRRVWEGVDVILWTTNNKYYSAFSDWMAPAQTAEENNIFVRDIVSPKAWKTATEDADGDPETWRYIPSGWSADLDSAAVDQWGSDLIAQFDTDAIIEEIERRAAEEEREAEREAEWKTCAW